MASASLREMDDEEEEEVYRLRSELAKAAIEWPPGCNTYFIPNSSIDRLLTPENIRKELGIIFKSNRHDLDRFAQVIVASRRKLFIVLLWGHFSDKTRRLSILKIVNTTNNITDEHLPFHRVGKHGEEQQVCSNGAKCSTKTCHRECVTNVMNHWSLDDRRIFEHAQWFVLAPVFQPRTGIESDGPVPNNIMDRNTILPFREDHKSEAIPGGFSQVWAVKIVASHQNFYVPAKDEGPEPFFAVKQLTRADEVAFKRETDMLTLLTELNHKHLIRLLTTYCFEGYYHLVFPYAAGNLRTFWAAIPLPYWNAETYLWVLDQMTGLASALMAIHTYKENPAFDDKKGKGGFSRFRTGGALNVKVVPGEAQYGRHGDIKPENLLWKADAKSPGILIVTDLGLGQFNRKESRSKIDPVGLGGSQTYIPPEHFLQEPISRAFDIWSLACVYLEFVTWLLDGARAVDDFSDSRLDNALNRDIHEDAYFTVTLRHGVRHASVRPAVTKHISYLRQHPRCSSMIRKVLDLVEGYMLKVHPHNRIKVEDLHERLRDLYKLSEQRQNREFLVGHRPHDAGKGVQSPGFTLE